MNSKQPSNFNNPTKQPVKPVASHSPLNPKPDGLPLPGDNLTSVAIDSQNRPAVPPAPGNQSQAAPLPIPQGSHVSAGPISDSTTKSTMESVKNMFGRWASKASEATKKGQDYAGDVWQHLKMGPSMTDAAIGRIAQGTKVLAEGGYEKIFRTTFQTIPDERLLKSHACYLSTSAGPVMGILYVSSAKLAFCSDNPLPYKVGEEKKWSYYKVVIPLLQIKTVQPSRSNSNPAEKYIKVISVDDHEFWFMGFFILRECCEKS